MVKTYQKCREMFKKRDWNSDKIKIVRYQISVEWMMIDMRFFQTFLFLAFVLTGVISAPALAKDISFSRDVLPVLSDRCFHCHGPDEGHREAELRLDVEKEAKTDRGDYAAITPGNLQKSELWNRIISDDEDVVMPPPDSHRKALTQKEQNAIKQWILDGAKWGKHWSFEQPLKPKVPDSANHPIDAFIRQRLVEEGLKPSPPAEVHTKLRRLSFALHGMSPVSEDVMKFTADPSEKAWESAIERMLNSPHYAERMAMWWLDAARYSDSDGYQQDQTRENWPWRDWVIRAFEKNMPFDQFTIEQFAGDLLPDATEDQILATCFHRNHMTNGEGGRDPEESRIDYVIDRVNTTGTVWLGLTLGCVQCHSHKFDPISQHDYYSLFAFFNSIDEDGRAGKGAKPYLKYTSPSVQSQIDELKQFVKQCETTEAKEKAAAIKRFDAWLENKVEMSTKNYAVWKAPKPSRISSTDGTKFAIEDDAIVQTSGPDLLHDDYRVVVEIPDNMSQVSGWRIEVLPHQSHEKGMFTRFGTGDFILTSVRVSVKREGSPSEFELENIRATADFQADKKRKTKWDTRYSRISETLNDDARDGWTTEGAETIEPHVGVYEFAEPWIVQPRDQLVIFLQQRSTQGHAQIGRFRISMTEERGETVRRADGNSPVNELYALKPKTAEEVPGALRSRLLNQYLLGDAEYQRANLRLAAARRQLTQLGGQAKPRSVMVLQQRKAPRDTHLLVRGVWDAKGDVVQTGVIPSVLKWPAEKTKTRLDLAKWLVDGENPLTARVVVNHLWQIMFGQGLVRTPDDFGLQGQFPTHPELLDYLAVELVEHNWDLRHILKLIATSETFQQSSVVTAELIERDPENRLLARSPKRRLPAWMIRDNALRVSGLLNDNVGGPPVFPYQPKGVWAEITMGRFRYQPSLGPAQYRRTVYAFWRRSSAPAFLFDSAQRRVCEVGVRQTNTPLHALTLMNDTAMLESSRAIAESVDANATVEASANTMALRILSRRLKSTELAVVHKVYDKSLAHYKEHTDSAVKYTTVGQRSDLDAKHAHEVAAWMTVAGMLMNLDEAISIE